MLWVDRLRETEWKIMVILIVLIILVCGLGTYAFGYFLRRGLKTGEIHFKGQNFTRERNPIWYWALMGLLVIWVILLPYVAIAITIAYIRGFQGN
jgi:hypothetical protein